MAGLVVADLPDLLGEIQVQLAALVDLHQILRQVQGVLRDQFRVVGGQHARVVLLEHVAAARAGYHDLVTLAHDLAQTRDVGLDLLLRLVQQPHVDERQAAALLLGNHALDAVLFQDADGRLADPGLVVVDGAGVEQRRLLLAVALGGGGTPAVPLGEGLAVIRGQQPVTVNAHILFHQTAQKRGPVGPVCEGRHPARPAPYPVRVAHHPVGKAHPFVLGFDETGPHHGPGEVDVPLVGRDVRTDGVTELALVTLIDYQLHLVVLQGTRVAEVIVHHLEQAHEGRTEGVAQRAAVADIEHPLQFGPQGALVPERRCFGLKAHRLASSSVVFARSGAKRDLKVFVHEK